MIDNNQKATIKNRCFFCYSICDFRDCYQMDVAAAFSSASTASAKVFVDFLAFLSSERLSEPAW